MPASLLHPRQQQPPKVLAPRRQHRSVRWEALPLHHQHQVGQLWRLHQLAVVLFELLGFQSFFLVRLRRRLRRRVHRVHPRRRRQRADDHNRIDT
jgi:hypothetical protein